MKSSNLQILPESRHTKEKHNVCASPVSTIYAVPVANWFAPLSNQGGHPVPKDRLPPSATPQHPKFPSSNAYKCIKRSRRVPTHSTDQHIQPRTHPAIDHNLQSDKDQETGSLSIPTLIDGVVSGNLNAKLDHSYRDSIANRVSVLRKAINLCKKNEHPISRKHKIILIGDSHIKGHGCNLKLLLSSNYKIYSIAKPGSKTSVLGNTAKEEISHLSHKDATVICCGSNDCDFNNFSTTVQNITNFVQANKHTNIILLNVPHRYDLSNAPHVNNTISILNRKLMEMVMISPHTSFLEIDNN